jgi:glycosyltransferase involved in cell wall biosynthesis
VKKIERYLETILGNFDPAQFPPIIAQIEEGIYRPKWSVMIPTYNCANYLKQTLKSVLEQDPGSEQMQIEVVDDCSTNDDPETVVREIGKGRVNFYRKQKNEGAILNFNTCVQRSHGELIHILHGDDLVLPGFYDEVENAANNMQDIFGFFTRCYIIDEHGEVEDISPRLPFLEVPSRAPEALLYRNQIYTPTVVLRRSFYEKNGAFLPDLVNVADWEMWLRCIRLGGAVFINKVLASYRNFPGNDSARLARTAENLRDNLRLNAILRHYHNDIDSCRFIDGVAGLALYQKSLFERLGDREAAFVNHEIWDKLVKKTPLSKRPYLMAKALFTALRQR